MHLHRLDHEGTKGKEKQLWKAVMFQQLVFFYYNRKSKKLSMVQLVFICYVRQFIQTNFRSH